MNGEALLPYGQGRSEFDDDVVIMDADVLYHPKILRRLVDSPCSNALLMDETVQQKTEECMVAMKQNRVIALSKSLPADYDCIGEGVGFLKVCRENLPHLVESIRSPIDAGLVDMEYEDALKDFFQHVSVGCERVGGIPWIEIDFPEDMLRAETEIVPCLSDDTNPSIAIGRSA